MKIDRLLSIVMHLLSRDLVSASELAGRFGTTVRTIQRDIETINQAGIPVTAIHGPNGGYKILDTFRLDRQFLTFDDLFFITTALQGIADSLESRSVEKTADKIRSLAARHPARELEDRAQRLYIDFSALGYSARRKEHLALIQRAISSNRSVSFAYTNAKLETTRRKVEPYAIAFKWFSWYLLAWCRTRQDFRLFRLSRIREPVLGPDVFRRRPIRVQEYIDAWSERGPKGTEVLLRFRPELRALVEDYFAFAALCTAEDGSILARFVMPEDNWLYGMILSYGDGVQVVSPEPLRGKITAICERTLQNYR